MTPLTFPCPACGRLMGVGLDGAGRPVRCPHCSQIVTAPSIAGPPGYPPAGLPPPAAPFPVATPPAPPTADPYDAAAEEAGDDSGPSRRAKRRHDARALPWKEAAIAFLALYGAGATAVAVRGWTRPLPAPTPPTAHSPTTPPPAKAKKSE